MKKSPVHYGNAMKTPCGLYCVDLPKTSKVWKKVTCKRCLRSDPTKKLIIGFINVSHPIRLVGGTEEYTE